MARPRGQDYARLMKNQMLLKNSKPTGFVLGAVLLAALSQCVGHAHAQSVGIVVDPPVVVVAPMLSPPAVLDDYLYYPGYGIYYNTYRHQYAHLEGDVWVWAPAPQGVTAEVLLTSPSVHMDFHDALEKHHQEMLRKYPRDWKPAAEHRDQKEVRKDAGSDHDNKDRGH